MKLYIAKINQDLQTRKVSKKLLATVNNYLNPQARIQKIASHLLLTHVLRIHHVSNSGISVNEYGKPFLKNQSLYFNLSHSDNYVICAVSKFSVGADIEKINQRIKSISQAFLSVSEQKMYHRSSAAKLTQIWTLKEAVVKLIGTGITKKMNSFPLDNLKISGMQIYTWSKLFNKNMQIAIAQYEKIGELKIIEVQL